MRPFGDEWPKQRREAAQQWLSQELVGARLRFGSVRVLIGEDESRVSLSASAERYDVKASVQSVFTTKLDERADRQARNSRSRKSWSAVASVDADYRVQVTIAGRRHLMAFVTYRDVTIR